MLHSVHGFLCNSAMFGEMVLRIYPTVELFIEVFKRNNAGDGRKELSADCAVNPFNFAFSFRTISRYNAQGLPKRCADIFEVV